MKRSINFGSHSGFQRNHFIAMLKEKKVSKVSLPSFNSEDFNFDEIASKGFTTPFVVIGKSQRFGLKVPDDGFNIHNAASAIGRDTPVRLIDVDTQSEIVRYNLGEYADYLTNRNSASQSKILNMISLEFSNSPLGPRISPPAFVDAIDWVETVWPVESLANSSFCRVQKYCLAGMSGSYTDFHIDFGGTSVWYHIVQGKKRFYLIPPTVQNLLIYESWTCSVNQSTTFLGDLVSECYYFDLTPGSTLIIPSGWIHAVYTPVDSLVFGGNFLHLHSIVLQLQANAIESRTNVSKAFTFPQFKMSHWYFLSESLRLMKLGINSKCPAEEGSVLKRFWEDMHLPFILKQIPILLRTFESWIHSDDNWSEESKSSYELLGEWWTVLTEFVEESSLSDKGEIIGYLKDVKESTSVDLFYEQWAEKVYKKRDRDVWMGGIVVHSFNVEEYDCWAGYTNMRENLVCVENDAKSRKKRRENDEEFKVDQDTSLVTEEGVFDIDDEPHVTKLTTKKKSASLSKSAGATTKKYKSREDVMKQLISRRR